jgi:protein-tyrosine phosphatase
MTYAPKKILEGAPNARDLGGMRTADGGTIRCGRLIRSGPINAITERDVKYLRKVGLNKVVDFRAEQEKGGREDARLEGVSYIDCPIIDTRAIGITHELPRDDDGLAQYYVGAAEKINRRGGGAESMRRMYADFTENEFALEHYRTFLDIVLSNGIGALLFHCTMGKDRVGAGTALILTALGVPRDDIMQDYLYTKVRLDSLSQELINRCRKFTVDENVLKTIYDMDTVDASYLGAVFIRMESISGSAESFMAERLDFAEEKRERLRSLYLE